MALRADSKKCSDILKVLVRFWKDGTITELSTKISRSAVFASCIDKIPNEVLKSDLIRNCLHQFFQYYFDTGLLPSHWLKAVIKPIPKSRTNDPRIPLNYRGVNLLSCIYKTYSCIINKRLSSFLERYHLIEDEQNGFRGGRSCLDHIYTLYSIIQNRKNQSKDTYHWLRHYRYMRYFNFSNLRKSY